MSKLSRILILLGLTGLFATSQVQRLGSSKPEPALGNPGSAIGSLDELKPYTAGGHVLGFRKGEMFIASGDHALRVEFVSARPVSPGEEAKSGDPESSRPAAQPLGKVSYRDLWDGVTLVYENHGSGVVKSTYHIEAGGTTAVDRVGQIRLRYNVPVNVDDSGDLVFSFATGEMRESRPVAWQAIEGKRVPVEATYRLISEQEVGFKAGSYDPRYPLVIDPVLSWNTFLGGSSTDYGYGIAVDTSGNVYVSGNSYGTWGSPIRPFSGYYDAFVAKLNGSGALQWNTFLGSSSHDYGRGIAVDTSGNVYMTGISGATWGSPVRPFSGYYDAFVAKLNGSGALQWNTFLGSSSDDSGYGIAVDTSGNVYMTGYSNATWGSPVRPGNGGPFAVKLNGNGVLQWNTFQEGSRDEFTGIAVDTSGNVYVSGYSYGTWGSPVRPFSGYYDAFVAKLNGSGALQWNTFLGSSNWDYGHGIAVDTSGNVYMTGYSYATWGSPVRPFSGEWDAFVAKLNGSGVLQWNTFLGSSNSDYGYGIAVDTSGNIFVGGNSNASWGSPDPPFASGYDAFATKLDNNGALLWNRFLGWSSDDYGRGIAVDTSGNVYMTGYSVATWGSPVRPFSGTNPDAFVAKIGCAVKNDFNGDGNEDILWRYYGSGGDNCVWFMGTIGGATALQAADSGINNRLKNLATAKVYADAREVGDGRATDRFFVDPREAGSLSLREGLAPKSFEDPRQTGGAHFKKDVSLSPENRLVNSPRLEGFANLQSPTIISSGIIGGSALPAVIDLNWQIQGTGDFNGDGKVDILWRYNGPGGYNCVWFMNGTTVLGGVDLPNVADLNWQIQGTNDFNGDGKVDILWRYVGSGGYNCVWFMNGTTVTGGVDLPSVSNLAWYIQGTGDFDGDGKVDILWRYYGNGGYNCVWFMNGTTVLGGVDLPNVTDLNWQIQGTGDFNGDDKVDILWRYYGSGGYNCVWFMNGTTVTGGADLPSEAALNWKIVSR